MTTIDDRLSNGLARSLQGIYNRLPTKETVVWSSGLAVHVSAKIIKCVTGYMSGVQFSNRLGFNNNRTLLDAEIIALDNPEQTPWMPVALAIASISAHVFAPAIRSCTEKCMRFALSIGSPVANLKDEKPKELVKEVEDKVSSPVALKEEKHLQNDKVASVEVSTEEEYHSDVEEA